MPLNGFEWNQAEVEHNDLLNTGLIAIIAFTPDRTPTLIGTGLVIGAFGNHATAITAAHNITEFMTFRHCHPHIKREIRYLSLFQNVPRFR